MQTLLVCTLQKTWEILLVYVQELDLLLHSKAIMFCGSQSFKQNCFVHYGLQVHSTFYHYAVFDPPLECTLWSHQFIEAYEKQVKTAWFQLSMNITKLVSFWQQLICLDIPYDVQALYTQQEGLGWKQLYYGWFSPQWFHVLQTHHPQINGITYYSKCTDMQPKTTVTPLTPP